MRSKQFGKDRVQQDKTLRAEGWGGSLVNEEARDKAKYLVKKGIKFPTAQQIDNVR